MAMTLRFIPFVLLTATLLLAAPNEKPTTRPLNPALEKQLREIDARASRIKDFTAEFRQEKFTALLRKPLISTGKVRVAGPIVRWDTAKPEPAVLRSDGREVRMYYPSQKLLEIYPIDQRLGDLATSPLPSLATVREHFTIEQSDGKGFEPPKGRRVLSLRLVPIDAALREHVDEVTVLLDVEAGHILAFEVVDADGDRTHVTFSGIRLDTGIRPADLDLTVPQGTVVSRPLEVREAPK
jgi:outer membrane lipoprotein-sorting protein